MKRLALPLLLCLLVVGGVGVAHGAGTKPTPVVAIAGDDVTSGMPDIGTTCPDGFSCISYGGERFDLSAKDGPVIGYVTERVERRDGMTVSGVVFIEQPDGAYKVAGTFERASANGLSEATFDDTLVLAVAK